jgi:hypothetical protein
MVQRRHAKSMWVVAVGLSLSLRIKNQNQALK